MYKKIAVAYNESPEARRALASAIHLAKILGAELRLITIVEGLPAFSAYACAADPFLARMLLEDQSNGYQQLQAEAREAALRQGVHVVLHLLDGEVADRLVEFLGHDKPDLLVMGLHRRTSHISRLWSTVYEIAQKAPCSVLGVH
jgi:Universal stress protein UspA and related nucleotide-binding proteins